MTVSSQIIEVIEALCEKFGIVIDWTSEKVMPYLEQLAGRIIQYEICSSIFWIVFWWALVLLIGVISIPICKKSVEHKWNTDMYTVCCFGIVALIALAVSTAIAIIVTGVQVYDIVEATYLPEKTIIDFIQRTLNNSTVK